MLINIQSDTRSAIVDTTGAELRSLKSLSSNDEFMWEGDPAVWSGIAPVLFPIVGGLKDNRMRHQGQTYKMDKHGFARRGEFTCIYQSAHQVTLLLSSDEHTMALFPWSFELTVDFSLEAEKLTISYQLKNTSEQTCLFNIGSHPAFRLPLTDSAIEDYSIEFSEPETLDVYKVVNDLLALDTEPGLKQENRIQLTPQIFDHDALVFLQIRSREISLVRRSLGKRVTVDTGGAPHLGIWAKPAAPYVCIEPWWGHADFANASGEFAEKASIQRVDAGGSFNTSIAITTHA